MPNAELFEFEVSPLRTGGPPWTKSREISAGLVSVKQNQEVTQLDFSTALRVRHKNSFPQNQIPWRTWGEGSSSRTSRSKTEKSNFDHLQSPPSFVHKSRPLQLPRDKQHFSPDCRYCRHLVLTIAAAQKVMNYELIRAAGSRHDGPSPSVPVTLLFMMGDPGPGRHSARPIPPSLLNLS